jgi:uncharacterized protein (TIGR02147 family)
MQTSKLLSEKFNQKKRANPAFSIRSWAAQMNLSSHGSLQQILAGKRTVPKKYIPSISKSLNFNIGETMYFETLVDFEKAKTQEEKEVYYERLNHLRPEGEKLRVLEIESYKYFENPLHSVIRTMVERQDFTFDLEKIRKQLKIPVEKRELEEVIERLLDFGFLVKDGKELKKVQKHIKNKIDVPSKAVQEYHAKMSRLAASEVKRQDVGEREFNSFCLNIKEGSLPAAKKKMRAFIEQFINEFEASENQSNKTYQLNLQLFSLVNELNNTNQGDIK